MFSIQCDRVRGPALASTREDAGILRRNALGRKILIGWNTNYFVISVKLGVRDLKAN